VYETEDVSGPMCHHAPSAIFAGPCSKTMTMTITRIPTKVFFTF
jgi:hypothetical protein